MPKIFKNVKENIIIEGKKILLEKNYCNLNIREICKNCNIATGTFYNYFSSKEDLVRKIFMQDWEKSILKLESIKNSNDSFKQDLKTIYLELGNFITTYLSIFYELSTSKNFTYSTNNHNHVYQKLSEILDFEKKQGKLDSNIDTLKFARFLIYNFVCMKKSNYITFDEFFNMLNI